MKFVTDQDLGEGLEITNTKLNAKLIFEDEEYEVPRDKIEALIFKKTKNAEKPYICTGVKVAGKWWGDAPEGEVAGDFKDLTFEDVVSASPKILETATGLVVIPAETNVKIDVYVKMRDAEHHRDPNDPENTERWEKVQMVKNSNGVWELEDNPIFPPQGSKLTDWIRSSIGSGIWYKDPKGNYVYPAFSSEGGGINFHRYIVSEIKAVAYDEGSAESEEIQLQRTPRPQYASTAACEVTRSADYVDFETSPPNVPNLRNARVTIDYPNGESVKFYTHLVSTGGSQTSGYQDPPRTDGVRATTYRGMWLEANFLHVAQRTSNYVKGERNTDGFDTYGYRPITHYGIEMQTGNVNNSKTVLRFPYSVFPKGTRIRIYDTNWDQPDFLIADEIL